jgi:protein gp37
VTAIEWTDATWNPVTGCSKVSAGCDNCYAETLSLRFGWSKLPWSPENAAENVVLHPERLSKPLSWRKPSMVFVNSMSDLFHDLVPDDYIGQVFDVMRDFPQHTFQVLTKRPQRMAFWTERYQPLPLPNVWLGTSIESDRYSFRANHLRETPAAVRFLSCEPLLGPLPSLNLAGIDWLIVGGESGTGHRHIDPEWVRGLRDAAQATRIADERPDCAFFFKQWGGRTPKTGGRELDGRTWDETP